MYFEKNTHSHAQGIASNFTPNHILNICYHKLPTHTRNIYHTNLHCFIHIYLYAYWKANYVMHILALKRESHAILHSFRKRPQYLFRKILIHTLQGISCHMFTYIHTIERCFPCYLYLHTYLHSIEKYFPRYPGAKSPSWGSQIRVKTLTNKS